MIHETAIKLNGKDVNLRFGMWTISQMIKIGYPLNKIQESIVENPFEFYANIVHLGACNAADKDLESYNVNDFYDWLDTLEGGLSDPQIAKVQKCFVDSLSFGVKQKDPKKK